MLTALITDSILAHLFLPINYFSCVARRFFQDRFTVSQVRQHKLYVHVRVHVHVCVCVCVFTSFAVGATVSRCTHTGAIFWGTRAFVLTGAAVRAVWSPVPLFTHTVTVETCKIHTHIHRVSVCGKVGGFVLSSKTEESFLSLLRVSEASLNLKRENDVKRKRKGVGGF